MNQAQNVTADSSVENRLSKRSGTSSDRFQMRRLLLTRKESAEALGMSLDHFERFVQPQLKIVRSGRLRLVPMAELERWVSANAESVLV